MASSLTEALCRSANRFWASDASAASKSSTAPCMAQRKLAKVARCCPPRLRAWLDPFQPRCVSNVPVRVLNSPNDVVPQSSSQRHTCGVPVARRMEDCVRCTAKLVLYVSTRRRPRWYVTCASRGVHGFQSGPSSSPHPVIAQLPLGHAPMRQRGRLPRLDPQRCVQIRYGGLSKRGPTIWWVICTWQWPR